MPRKLLEYWTHHLISSILWISTFYISYLSWDLIHGCWPAKGPSVDLISRLLRFKTTLASFIYSNSNSFLASVLIVSSFGPNGNVSICKNLMYKFSLSPSYLVRSPNKLQTLKKCFTFKFFFTHIQVIILSTIHTCREHYCSTHCKISLRAWGNNYFRNLLTNYLLIT